MDELRNREQVDATSLSQSWHEEFVAGSCFSELPQDWTKSVGPRVLQEAVNG